MNVLQYEDSGYRKKQEQIEKDKFAIAFAVWINENGYEDYWNKSPSWVSTIYVSEFGEENAKRYYIEELLEEFKKQ